MAKERPGVMLYWETFEALEDENLSDSEVRRLLRSIHLYSQYGEVPDFSDSPSCRGAWVFIRPKIDSDGKRYEQIRAARRAAVNGRWNNNDPQTDPDE